MPGTVVSGGEVVQGKGCRQVQLSTGAISGHQNAYDYIRVSITVTQKENITENYILKGGP